MGFLHHIYILGVGWLMSLLLEPKMRLELEKIVSPAPLRSSCFFMNTSCHIAGGLTLHHSLPSASADCQRAALELVASRVVALVVTWSAGSLSADRGGFSGLERVSASYRGSADVVALAYGKGSPCHRMPPPLRSWVGEGSALCISGPNMGAREAHSVLHFCSFFYEHLPRAVVFMQDDPHALDLGNNGRIHDWALALKVDAAARLAAAAGASRWQSGRQHPVVKPNLASAGRSLLDGLLPPSSAAHWRPSPCACRAVRELFFTEAKYGGYRPMAFLMRTFFVAFRNRTELPATIVWPAGAQFAAARLTVRSKPAAFWRALLGLASPVAPLKREVPRLAGATDHVNNRNAKWANFGRAVVDLGPTRAGLQVADNRAGISGMDFAQAQPLTTLATLTTLTAPCAGLRATFAIPADPPPPPPLTTPSNLRAGVRAALVSHLRPGSDGQHAALPPVLHRRGARAVARALRHRAVPLSAAH